MCSRENWLIYIVLDLSARDVLEPPIPIQVIVTALGCPTELGGKTVLLQTPHILVIGHERMVLTGKLPPCWSSVIVLESVIQASLCVCVWGGGCHQILIVTSVNYNNGQDTPLRAIVALAL